MKTSCPCCGEIYYDIPDKWLGQKARCEHCGKEFTVQIYYPPPPEPVKPEFFIEVTCPICKNKFDVSESSIGKSYTCPKCGNNFLSFCEIPQNVVSFTCTYCHKQQTIPKEKASRNNGGIISCAYCKEIYSGNKFSLIKIPFKPSRSSKRTSQPATTHSVNHQSVPSPSGSISYSRDPGIYILLALLFGGLGAHNLYAKENSKFVFKLIMSGLTLVCSIAAIANQPSVEYNRYTYSVTTHTPGAYPICMFFIFLCAVINLIAIFADIINADANCKGHL